LTPRLPPADKQVALGAPAFTDVDAQLAVPGHVRLLPGIGRDIFVAHRMVLRIIIWLDYSACRVTVTAWPGALYGGPFLQIRRSTCHIVKGIYPSAMIIGGNPDERISEGKAVC
jgi:hypothetical protein